jgi:hypothetical protein
MKFYPEDKYKVLLILDACAEQLENLWAMYKGKKCKGLY